MAKVRKTEAATCAHCGNAFSTRVDSGRRGGPRYCSRRCWGDARRQRVTTSCDQCGKAFNVIPARATGGSASIARFCSAACHDAARRRWAVLTCPAPGCGKTFQVARGQSLKGRRFCSVGCAHRKQVAERACEHCGRPFSTARRGAVDPGRFCSSSCAGLSRRRFERERRSCPTCGAWFEAPAWSGQRYCSPECVIAGRPRKRVDLACERCGNPVTVSVSRAKTRRFCSQQCRWGGSGRRKAKCRVCTNGFVAFRSAARRFCSGACYHRSRAPRARQCSVCGTAFQVPLWQARPSTPSKSRRQQMFCSLKCAGTGRRGKVQQNPERDARIVALHLGGLRGPAILAALRTERVEWGDYDPSTIRQVIARKCPHCLARRAVRTV